MFERQGIHLVALGGLLAVAAWLGRATVAPAWFWASLAAPVGHQVFVWYCWRAQLFDVRPRPGFRAFGFGFAAWGGARFVTMVGLAVVTADTMAADLRWLAGLVALPAGFALYSVARYFTFRRAVGIDHFDTAYRGAPLVSQGIFRFTRNGMYTYAMLLMWLPGLWWSSRAALISAGFTHAYIWVHYYCTELPDMERIYGEEGGQN